MKLYERDVPLVQIGQPVDVIVEALPGEVFKGTVTFKAFQLDPQTRTLDARVEVKNPDMRLLPGMFADAAHGGAGRSRPRPQASRLRHHVATPEDAKAYAGGAAAVPGGAGAAGGGQGGGRGGAAARGGSETGAAGG